MMRFLGFLYFFITACSILTALPGDIIDISIERSYSPAQIDEHVVQSFTGFTAPRALVPVDAYRVVFESTYLDGSPARVTAHLLVPRGAGGETPPVYVFGPGTTGLIDACAPSREYTHGIVWGRYRQHVLAHAGQGLIGIVPDYIGFGDPERHQAYMIAPAGGRVLLDAARAVRNFVRERLSSPAAETANFLAGFSQGGHSLFAAADIRSAYAPDIDIAGLIGYGPTTDLVDLILEYPASAPMIMYTFAEIYGTQVIDPGAILQDRWYRNLEKDVTRQCIGAMQSYYPWDASLLFRPGFYSALKSGTLHRAYPKVYAVLKENSPGLSGHGIPALILQGKDDSVISPEIQTRFVVSLRRMNSDVRYLMYDDTRHDTRARSFADVRTWIIDRIEGQRSTQ